LTGKLTISPNIIRNWKRFAEAGAPTAVQASDANVLEQIRAVTNSRATYGHSRVWG